MSIHAREVAEGQRFEFGENWRAFLAVLDEERVREARESLKAMLGVHTLEGLSFLDIGSGSGLFSLAAVSLNARRVHSFDFDPSSVGCTAELRHRYASGARHWTVEQGSVLDRAYLQSLGQFDIVYSWGVLHHTGNMLQAMANASLAVAPGGRLFISIYNDQGLRSRIWRRVKKTYNALPRRLRPAFVMAVMGPLEFYFAAWSLIRLKPQIYVRSWTEYKRRRGMSRWHDLVDWVGGYPFEVATPERIFDFFRERGFSLTGLRTCRGGLGCNQFVFEKTTEQRSARAANGRS